MSDARQSRVRRLALRPTKRWLLRALYGYLFAATAALGVPGYEVFPFFSWFLFPLTPNIEERWQLELLELGGQRIEPSVRFMRAQGRVDTHSVDAFFAIQRLGRSVQRGAGDAVTQSRSLMESRFLTLPCRYRLVYRRFDALDAARGAADIERVVTADFNCGQAALSPGSSERALAASEP